MFIYFSKSQIELTPIYSSKTISSIYIFHFDFLLSVTLIEPFFNFFSFLTVFIHERVLVYMSVCVLPTIEYKLTKSRTKQLFGQNENNIPKRCFINAQIMD